jgi:lipopolysaccharide/colanic/teichoic acid biosynthesis glycosyltransferase
MTTASTRTRYALVSVGLDLLVLAAAGAFAPLDWDLDRAAPGVVVPLTLSTLVGLFLAGGYRLAFPLGPALARLAPLGFAFGAAAGWLVLKLLSQKTDLWQLIPPALEEFTPTVVVAALAAWAHRAVHLRALAGRETRVPVALLAAAELTPTSPVLARWRERGWSSPHVVITTGDLAGHDLVSYRALVILLALRDLDRPSLEAIAQARARGLPLMTAARFEEELFGYTPLDAPDDPWLLLDDALERRSSLYLGAKRLLDLLLALALGALLLAPFLALALALRLLRRGPVFYRQTRAGLNRRPFTLWKLRTMVEDAESASGPTFAHHGDPRVTRAGRFLRRAHLDELPQLYNILKGDMSFVGPRPERPELDRELAPRIPYYALRHLARPGLTGWAQVRLGYGSSPGDAFRKLEHDVYYLKNASLSFDLAIPLRTIPAVLGLRGR